MVLACAPFGWATSGTVVNNTQIIAPPQPIPVIDATNFVNNNLFLVQTTDSPFNSTAEDIFDFSSVENFTNNGVMVGYPGIRFDTSPASAGSRHWAKNFVNANRILPNGANSGIYGEFFIYVQATNIINRGLISLTNRPVVTFPDYALNILPTIINNEYGLISLTGDKVDVSSSGFNIASGFEERQVAFTRGAGNDTVGYQSSALAEGMYDTYWGFGSNNPPISYAAAFGPTNAVTTRFLTSYLVPGANATTVNPYVTNENFSPFALIGPGLTSRVVLANTIKDPATATPTANRSVQIVYLLHTNASITTNVTFYGNSPTNFGIVVIDWFARPSTNVFGEKTTNHLRLIEYYGLQGSNSFYTNYSATTPPPEFRPLPPQTFQPINFNFFRGAGDIPRGLLRGGAAVLVDSKPFAGFLNGGAAVPPNLGGGTNILGTNTTAASAYSAYRLRLTTTSIDPQYVSAPLDATFTEKVRALPGRVEITGNQELNLAFTRIQSLNYTLLRATNHFVSSINASIDTAYSDIYLGSTNGNLTITNLVRPAISRIFGDVEVYSTVFSNYVEEVFRTNVFPAMTADVTNTTIVPVNVIMVDSTGLKDSGPANVLDLQLNSYTSGYTNAAGARIHSGADSISIGDVFNVNNSFAIDADVLTVQSSAAINLLSDYINWSDGVPNLLTLTNKGTITSTNSIFFLGYYGTDGLGQPYRDFVNLGTITAQGEVISATNVQNRGVITSINGPILVSGDTIKLANFSPTNLGAFNATNGIITIGCNNLVVSNHVLNAGHSLSLSVTNDLRDGFPTATNGWSVSDGFNLLVKPTTGDLWTTVVTNSALSYAYVNNFWAATNLGVSTSGFTNNAAIGKLILDGGLYSRFAFTGTGVSNAIYVDSLDLRNGATGVDIIATNNLTGISLAPNINVYYANSKGILPGVLNGKYGLDGSNGGRFFWVSSRTNGPFSSSLVNLPGGGTKLVNTGVAEAAAAAAAGVVPPANYVDLTITPLGGSGAVGISWNTAANALNHILYKDSLGNGEWKELVTVVSGPVAYRQSAVDPLGGQGRFYRIRVDVPTP